MEPGLRCVAALHSPSTGIIDTHALMLAYQGDAEAHGAMLALRSKLVRCEVVPEGFVLRVESNEAVTLQAEVLINSAGLRAPSVARAMRGYPPELAPRELDAKGNY